jgi:hypothetical protein
VCGLLITLVGLIITVTAKTHGAKYAGLCILLFGSYISAPLTVAWLSGNTPEPGKRALVLGVNGFGNLSGVIGSRMSSCYLPPVQVRLTRTRRIVSQFVCAGLSDVSTLYHHGHEFPASSAFHLMRADMCRPFYVTLAFIAVALAGYLSYRFTLAAVNRHRRAKVANMTPEEVEDERLNSRRYADKKLTFMYGL